MSYSPPPQVFPPSETRVVELDPATPARPRHRGSGEWQPHGLAAARVASALTAVAAVVAFWFVWKYLNNTVSGQQLERVALAGGQYGQGKLWTLAEPVLDVVSVSFVAIGIVVAMAIAMVRRRWAVALHVAIVVGGANITTRLLKFEVLHRDNLLTNQNQPNSLPSGHTTVAASVSAALILAVPRRARPWVAVLGAAYTAATGVSTQVGQWHRASDVIAGLLVVTFWVALVNVFTTGSALDPSDNRSSTWVNRAGAAFLVIAAGCAGLASWYVLRGVYPASWDTTYRQQVEAYVGTACAVVAATALAFAVILVIRNACVRPAQVSSAHRPRSNR